MLVNYFIVTNSEEIERADQLGLPTPKAKTEKRPMIFSLGDIFNARINQDGNIELCLSDGYSYEIEYSDSLWNRIMLLINEREKPFIIEGKKSK